MLLRSSYIAYSEQCEIIEKQSLNVVKIIIVYKAIIKLIVINSGEEKTLLFINSDIICHS